MSIINVKFDVYFKRELGTLFKSNEVDLDGLEANVNLDLDLVENMKINYLINGNKLTDDIAIKDIEKNDAYCALPLAKPVNYFLDFLALPFGAGFSLEIML